MNITLWLSVIQIALQALKADPNIDPKILTYIADGEDAFAKALAAHNAAQIDQTEPLNPLPPIS